jgi:hypothetical protein
MRISRSNIVQSRSDRSQAGTALYAALNMAAHETLAVLVIRKTTVYLGDVVASYRSPGAGRSHPHRLLKIRFNGAHYAFRNDLSF